MANKIVEYCSCGRLVELNTEVVAAKRCKCGTYVLPCTICEFDNDCLGDDRFCPYRMEIINGKKN